MVIDAFLAAILRGEQADAAALSRHDPDAILHAASNHDVVPLLAEALAARADIPEALQARLHERARQAVASDMLREVEIQRFIAELDTASIGSLIIKGSQLAYTHYPRPDLRPRADTDVLILGSAQTAVHEVLTARLGYEAISKISDAFSRGQRRYIKYREGAIVHAVDVQWKTASPPSPQVIAGVASYTEMVGTAVPLPRLGTGARGPSAVYALLIACLHRFAHQPDAFHFKRLYDIDLIARKLTADQWREFVSLAVDQKVASVCRRSLERAAYWFRTEIPMGIESTAGAAAQPASTVRPSA